MRARFRELAWSRTEMGVISLRRRVDPALGTELYEVKLDEEFLMSSLFTTGEVETARLGLAELAGDELAGDELAGDELAGDELAGDDLDVVVGGLGLGYTARAALENPGVRSLIVVEALEPVIEWHRDELLPDTAGLASDPRTRLVHGDFFAMLLSDDGLDPEAPDRRFHAILVDIDHSPGHVLHPSHAAFYTSGGVRSVVRRLLPGGVFTLWSDDPPDAEFTAVLAEVFESADARVVTFANPLTGGESASTVYVAKRGVDG